MAAARRALHGTIGFVGDVARAFTWRRFLLIEAVFVVVDTIANYVMVFPDGVAVLRLVIGQTMAFCMVLSVTIGDQAVVRGVRPFAAYGAALALTSYAGAHVQSWILIALGREPPGWDWLSVVDICFETATYSAAFTLGYVDYRRRVELVRRVRAAELRRARDERQLVESRLAAARAELDPQRLLDEIGALQRSFVADPARAERELDALIDGLREKMAPPTQRAVATA
ncbi:MAG TPA: hypothetical protein VMJ74_11520 [Pseudomonadales bacterium]|nr:hypothetical protein [Pseudomonadales bacterium]